MVPTSSRLLKKMKQAWKHVKEMVNSVSNADTWEKTIRKRSRTGFTNEQAIPDLIRNRLVSVLEARTKAQLVQLQESIMKQKREERFPEKAQFKEVGWTLSRKTQFEPLVYGPQEALWYSAYPVNTAYSVNHRVLTDLKKSRPTFKPKSVLDFGAGPGTSSWAAQEVFGESIDEYCVIEPSQAMVDVLKVTMEDFPGLQIRRTLAEMSHELKSDQRFDLVTASHVFSELPSDLERVTSLSALWKLVSDDGMLVLVDRGSAWGSLTMRSARQLILDSFESDPTRGQIVGPCPHLNDCPMAEGSWCHFIQRSPNVKFPKTNDTRRTNGFRTSKYSYIIMSKLPTEKVAERWGRLVR